MCFVYGALYVDIMRAVQFQEAFLPPPAGDLICVTYVHRIMFT